MKRRNFLAAISCLPFLGFLKPEPQVAVFSNSHESSISNLNTASGGLYKETDADDGYRQPDPLSAEDLQKCRKLMRRFADAQFENTQQDAADFFNNGFIL